MGQHWTSIGLQRRPNVNLSLGRRYEPTIQASAQQRAVFSPGLIKILLAEWVWNLHNFSRKFVAARSPWSQETPHPTNTTHWNNVVLLLAHRLRRWPSIKPTLFQCFVFAGQALHSCHNMNSNTRHWTNIGSMSRPWHNNLQATHMALGGKKRIHHVYLDSCFMSAWSF